MADIDFYQEDSDDTSDSSLGLDGTGFHDDDCYGPDDHLSPLQKLEKYMNCDNIFSRQMVAKSMLDTLRAVGGEMEECDAILKAMVRLSDDAEATVRSELMEQVPHVAMYCIENKHIFPNSVPTYILPMVVKYLNDMNNQVRKTSQAALLVVLEQDLVDKEDIEEQVVGVISDLARPDSPDDFRSEAVALMSKLAPLLGREITETQFLPRFCEMCTDSLFHVRKVCAANFGEICSVVGPESVEEQLLPKFYYLCEDGVWGVRKACAECFMVVSRACTSETRRSQLANIFVNLLCDMSRWVRVSAFQALGPFISTYADPRIMELLVREGITSVEGEIFCDMNNSEELQSEGGQGEGSSDSVESDVALSTDADNKGQGDQTTTTDLEDMEIDTINCDKRNEDEVICTEHSDPSNNNIELSPEERRFEQYNQNQESCDDNAVEESSLQESDTLPSGPVSDTNKEFLLTSGTEGEVLSEQCSHSIDYPNTKSDLEINSENSLSEDEQNTKEPVDTTVEDERTTIESVDTSDSTTSSATTESNNSSHTDIQEDNVAYYNSFQFWRPPILSVDLNLDLVHGTATHKYTTAKSPHHEQNKTYSTQVDVSISNKNNSGEHGNSSVSKLEFNKDFTAALGLVSSENSSSVERSSVTIHTASVSTVNDTSETLAHIASTHVLGHNLKSLSLEDNTLHDLGSNNLGYIDTESLSSTGSSMRDSTMFDECLLSQQQDVIPAHLLEQYLSMADPTRAQTVDSEITRHCAYSLPAVAFTLGRKNWPCLKILYETLASDMQWKVRRTLAFSIHELALIVGEDITHNDLVPVFDGFLKDLDEVREGVLKHFSDFLRLLRPEVRREYLPRVMDFMTTDNQKNWRFRLELAEQLIDLCKLFSGPEICEYLIPIGMSLVIDRVASVRQISCRLMAVMICRLCDEDDEMVNPLLRTITDRFAHSNRWHQRQLYAQLCLCLLEENALAPGDFASLLLPHLLMLSEDNIPNVRISLAKTLARTVLRSDYFTSYQNPHHDELLKSIQTLKSDVDRDVRYFFSHPPEHTEDYTDHIPV